jgi:hypothetical protein
MPLILPDSLRSEVAKTHGTVPYVWLAEIELARPDIGVPAVLFPITSYHTEVTWPIGSPNVRTWYPFPFTFTPIEQNQEGDLPQVEMAVDNTTRTLMRYLHEGDGMEGNAATLYLLTETALAIAYPDHEAQRIDLRIAGASAGDAVSFRLEHPNYFARRSPQDRYIPGRCRLEYGSTACGYVLNAFAAFPTCPKTSDACALRGDDHVARGLPRLHPKRFGGTPGAQGPQQ